MQTQAQENPHASVISQIITFEPGWGAHNLTCVNQEPLKNVLFLNFVFYLFEKYICYVYDLIPDTGKANAAPSVL